MTSRQVRRAEERRLRKLARKTAHQPAAVTTDPVPAPSSIAPIPAAPAGQPQRRSRAEINRQNALRSTGPSTERGKSISSRNAFKHGFSAVFSVLPSEDQNAFDQLLDALRREHQPAGATEEILVERMAQHYWLSQRAIRLQDLTLTGDRSPADQEKSFALYLRYQTANDRAFSKCLSDLLKLKAAGNREHCAPTVSEPSSSDSAAVSTSALPAPDDPNPSSALASSTSSASSPSGTRLSASDFISPASVCPSSGRQT